MKRVWPVVLSVLFGIGLTIAWLSIADIPEMLKAFAGFHFLNVVPLGFLFVAVYFLRSLRWKIILSPVTRIGAFESFKLCMTNYLVNFLIPIHAGEVVKSVLLKRMKGTPVSKSLLAAYIDKLADLLPLFLLLVATPFLSRQINSVIYIISGVILIGFVLLAVLLISVARKRETTLVLIEKCLFFLPNKLKSGLRRNYLLFWEAVTTLPLLSSRLLEIAAITLSALALHCVYLWLFFHLFGINLSALTVFVGYLLLNASFILPAPPGFSGSLELTVLFIFSYLYRYDKNVVSAMAASSHLFAAALFGVLGLASVALIGVRLTSLFRLKLEEAD
jgi:uncharacterized protein (TIRG00374 family)